jgi:GTPase Era involved in 16S rRNA processing
VIGETPTFAIVGAVNHGKSSVVSTLAENDQVRISSMPGETVECQLFWLLDLFKFYDTPGFQNPIEALPELLPAAQAPEPLAVFRQFVERHRGNAEFEAECVLLQPLLEGAGIVYVVDGSEPLLEVHRAEMEILRLTAQPRLAVINRTSADDHVQEWKSRLGQHFNAVREFNAHSATFADRLELLETLGGLEQGWRPKLTQAIAIFREEREARITDCAEIIVELLIDALTHREHAPATSELKTRRAKLGEELKRKFIAAVCEREAQAHREIIELFLHRYVTAEVSPGQIFDTGLFSDATWRAFGLDVKQLVVAATISGAATGAIIDVSVGGHSFLLGTAIGGVTGAAGAFLVGKQRPELKVALPGQSAWLPKHLRLGGNELVVGPYTAINFPWILLDRAIGTFCYVNNRAHARRDRVTLTSEKMKATMEAAGVSSARWDEETRKRCERLFQAIRRGKLGNAERETLREIIRSRLEEVSRARFTPAGVEVTG